jgi:Uma2 family endonuclease
MSTQPQRHFTLEEYFALEHASEVKYEYWQRDVLAMSGASPVHLRSGTMIPHPVDIRLEIISVIWFDWR